MPDPEQLGASLDVQNEPILIPPVEGAEPATEPIPAPEPVEPQEDEITRLQRIIATDPNLRQNYANQYYPPQQPQQPQYQPPQQMPQAPQQPPGLPFEPSEYNPYNLEHQAALTGFVIQQQLAPAMQYITSLQQNDQIQQQQQQQAQAQAQMQDRQKMMEKTVPGFQAWTQPGASPEQVSVASFADREYLRLLSSVDPNLQNDPRVQQHIINQLAPKVKALASKFGVSAPPASAPNTPVYVEGSQRVPTSDPNAFDVAFKNDDTLGMIQSLGKLKAR